MDSETDWHEHNAFYEYRLIKDPDVKAQMREVSKLVSEALKSKVNPAVLKEKEKLQ